MFGAGCLLVYSIMRVDALAALVPFASLGDIEQIIVDAIKHNYLAVRCSPALNRCPSVYIILASCKVSLYSDGLLAQHMQC